MWHRVSRFPQDGIRKRYGRIYEGQKETSTSRRSETGSRVGVVKPTQFGSDPSPMIQLDDLPPRSPPPPPPKPTRGPGEKTSSSRDHQDPFTQPHFFDFAPTYMQEYDFDDEAGIYHLIASETRYAEVPLTVLLTQNDPSFPEKPAPKFKPMPQNKPASKGNPMDRPAPTTKEGNPTAKDSSTAKGVPGAQTAPKTQRISINESVNWAQNMYGAQTIPGTNRKKDDHDHEFLGKLRITRIWSLTEHVEYFV